VRPLKAALLSKPIILTVDDDAQVSAAIGRDIAGDPDEGDVGLVLPGGHLFGPSTHPAHRWIWQYGSAGTGKPKLVVWSGRRAEKGPLPCYAGGGRGRGSGRRRGSRAMAGRWVAGAGLLDGEAPARWRGSVARPGRYLVASLAKPRRGALLSSDDYGSSVERRGGGHPVLAMTGRDPGVKR
jgi:hypothetical protein